ncbi:MAG TPA: hypothetical protein VLV25_10200 [Steroidobacteraceae bacterium]|nr:hypothetical protein [Steroidobacteraceae bacterium]
MLNNRRSDFDVTNTVQVSSPRAVLEAVTALLRPTWPKLSLDPVERAFEHFERLFAGEVPGFHGVDTVYHDRQHTLDITLALSRLIAGYERQAPEEAHLGGTRAIVGLVTALFHDVGYLRRTDELESRNGAEFTRVHVSRGARFLEEYLPVLGLGAWVPMATQIIHFTGYEVPFAQIESRLPDRRDVLVGHLLGTADMIAQIADRCYLEKCRDRLYAEFVLGGVALPFSGGYRQVKYASGLDLLRQTPEFIEETRRNRLDRDFGSAYRYLEILFNGRNPYIESIDRNVEFLRQVLRSENWQLLRRRPPIFAAVEDPMGTMRGLMLGYIKRVWANY